MGDFRHHYRGFHPVRFNAQVCALLAEKAARSFGDFVAQVDPGDVSFRRSTDYLCNVVFSTRTETYWDAVGGEQRLVDAFDEVPLNQMIQRPGNFYLIASNALAVHLLYNTAYSQIVRFGDACAESRLLEELMAAELQNALLLHEGGSEDKYSSKEG
jgi:hypothetical protein